jgi:tRNA-2-methylthio-N6-dimethylallyladenosine synthase
MNERDSEQVARMFTEGGYTVTKDEFDADAILVNTCSVRDQAEQKALGKMGHMGKHRQRKPHVVYGFMGCMAQSRGSELFQNVPHLDVVVGTQKYHKVFEYVDVILKNRLERRMDDLELAYKGDNICDIAEEKNSQNTIKDHVNTTTDPTAFVSIMQGCNMKCSYCIVPDTRGRERGRPIADIVRECETLTERGVKEVTLLGQIVNLYGRTEFPKVDGKSPFVQLLEAVHAIDGIKRIRFTSPHPIGFRDDLIAAYGYLPKLCSHIHFPMQSGSDRVLKQMRRPYKNAKFIEIIENIKSVRPDMSVTTDVIVGFPSETEEEFQMTFDTMDQMQFDNAFVYRYSERRNTPAAERLDQVAEPIKEKRNQVLLALVDEIAQRTNHALVGSIQEVLCTGPSKNNPDTLNSRTGQNKIVIIEGNSDRLVGKIFKTKIHACTGFTLYGTPIVESIED